MTDSPEDRVLSTLLYVGFSKLTPLAHRLGYTRNYTATLLRRLRKAGKVKYSRALWACVRTVQP